MILRSPALLMPVIKFNLLNGTSDNRWKWFQYFLGVTVGSIYTNFFLTIFGSIFSFIFKVVLKNEKFMKMRSFVARSLLILFLIPITSSDRNFTDSAVASGSLFCVDLPIRDANRSFCGIASKWEPRISKVGGIFACSVLTLISLVLTIFIFIKTWKTMIEIFANETVLNSCLGYALFYGKLLFDVVDVAFDSSLFYRLELGQLIDENITRNNHVNNSILAFAAIGSVKLIFFHLPFNDDYEDQESLNEIKEKIIWFGFFLEDGPELFLEYFYIEKYVTLQPPWYLFTRDILLALISFYMVCNACKSFTNNTDIGYGSLNCKAALSLIIGIFHYPNCVLLVSVLMLLRVGGAGYQYVTGKLTRECFVVENGILLQIPFSHGCLREIDYAIIVLGCILVSILFVGFCLQALCLRVWQCFTENFEIILMITDDF